VLITLVPLSRKISLICSFKIYTTNIFLLANLVELVNSFTNSLVNNLSDSSDSSVFNAFWLYNYRLFLISVIIYIIL
jgi:hypothetical protein